MHPNSWQPSIELVQRTHMCSSHRRGKSATAAPHGGSSTAPGAGSCPAAARKAHSRRAASSRAAAGAAGMLRTRCVSAARKAYAWKSRRPCAWRGVLRTPRRGWVSCSV